MQNTEKGTPTEIVLVGGGHSHVEVIRRFGLRPLPAARLTVICTDAQTPYSGMLPGYVAGHYEADDIHIDLPRLADWAGVLFVQDEVVGIDRQARTVRCASGLEMRYDYLSLNIGSAPRMGDVAAADSPAVPVKPIRNFRRRWLDLLQRVCTHREPSTTIAVVGAGAGGVELLLAMQHRLRREIRASGRQPDQLRFHLFTSSAQILPTHAARVRERFMSALAERGVMLHLGVEVGHVRGGHIETRNGVSVDADEIVWVTQAGGAPWLRDTGLALDPDGFVQVDDNLRTVSDERIFAAGDVASLVSRPLAKAGVFAVRQGPILAENLRRAALGQALLRYRPQRRWLALITTGERYAVASWGPLGVAGRWVWRWKDAIDRRFMARYRELPARRASA